MPHAALATVLKDIQRIYPSVIRVTTYVSAKSISGKTDEQISELRERNLKLFHLGLESRNDDPLKYMSQYGNAQFHIG